MPSHNMFLSIYSFEHGKYELVIIVIKEPDAWVFVIFLKRHSVAAGDIDGALRELPSKTPTMMVAMEEHPQLWSQVQKP